jgi:MFS family permease
VVLLEITGQAFWTGIATFAAIFPSMLLGPLAGNLADRFERRKLLIVGQSGAAVAAFTLWLVWFSGVREPAVIVAVAAFTGVFGAFTIPAWQSFIPLLVPMEDLPSAISMNSLQFNAARGIGPALGGVILTLAGPSWAFLGNSLSYAAVVVALLLVRPVQTRQVQVQRKVGRGFVEAVRYVHSQPGIAVGIGLAAVVAFLGFPLLNFAAVFVQQVYEVDRGYVGLLGGLLGAGAVIAVPVVSGMFGDLRRSSVIQFAVPFYGVAIIIFGSSTTVTQGCAGLLLAGSGFMMIVVTSNTAVQSIVNEQIRGRVMALRIMTFTGAFPIGALLQTRLSDATSPRLVVTGAGTIVLIVGFFLVIAQRHRLSRLDDPTDTRSDLSAVLRNTV